MNASSLERKLVEVTYKSRPAKQTPPNASRAPPSSRQIVSSSQSTMPLTEVAGSWDSGSQSRKSNESITEARDLTDSHPPESPSYASTTKSSSPPVSPSGSGPKLRLSLDRFAFPDSSANAPAVAVQKEQAPSDEKPKCLRRRRPHYSIAKGVSRASFSRLSRCVCCETRWTVKKSAAQKLSHMDACSRKCSYSSETMTFLIKKELNVIKEAAVDDAEADTHLQSIVQNAGSKKRQRTKGPTVQQYTSQTREVILKRARRILGPTMNLDENDAFLDLPVSTQAVMPHHSMVSTDVVALDVSFRPSKLRYRSCEGTDLKVSPLIGPLESM